MELELSSTQDLFSSMVIGQMKKDRQALVPVTEPNVTDRLSKQGQSNHFWR